MSVPTKEQLKARSKHLAKLLKEKFNIEASHAQCLDVVAQLFGFKDWQAANAAAPRQPNAVSDTNAKLTLAEYFNRGYSFSVEQPFKVEKYFAGGSTASHSIEEGVRPVGPFTFRADHQNKLIWITLPLENRETTTDPVIGMHKHLYGAREKEFAEKFGGTAEDFFKKKFEDDEKSHPPSKS